MQSGREFFSTACAAADSEAAKAYLYGLLGHYCLDSVIHPYVDRLVAAGEAEHVPLESELERFLMEKDGISSPHTFNRGELFRLTRGECMTAAKCYPGVTGGQVSHSISVMALCTRLLAHPNRKLQEWVLNPTAPQFLDHRLPTEENKTLAPYVSRLHDLFRQALSLYPDLLKEITEYMQTGKALSEAFLHPFG
jgi:hypothetical protein